MAAVTHDLGQGEIETCLGFRPGLHRYAKARSARLAAIHGDDEGALAPRPVVRIDVGSAEEHPILDGDRVEFAGAHAEEGEALAGIGLRHDADALRIVLGAPETQQRRVQELLPRMRSDGVAEQRLIIAAYEPVGPAVLLVGPAARQVVDGGDVVIDDRLVADRRADNTVAALPERIEQDLEPIGSQDSLLRGIHEASSDELYSTWSIIAHLPVGVKPAGGQILGSRDGH